MDEDLAHYELLNALQYRAEHSLELGLGSVLNNVSVAHHYLVKVPQMYCLKSLFCLWI